MDIEGVWAYVLLMTVVVGVVTLAPFRAVDNADEASLRYASIDGLRGFLAQGVFVYHLVVTYGYIRTGEWTPPTSSFYVLLGPVGVSLFFMITGFLFWAKMLRARGRPDWRVLYIGRLCRIGPMYLVVVVAMLVFVFASTGLSLREPGLRVASAILQWLALGIVDTQPEVNGYAARHVLAGVTWTIFYEWAFYVSLLGTAWFARGRHHLWFVGVALVLALVGLATWQLQPVGFAALFVCGMVVASLLHNGVRLQLPDRLASALAFACLGLVLSAVFAVPAIRDAALADVLAHWLAGVLCAVLLLVVSALCYVHIEKVGIRLGKRWIQIRRAPRPGSVEGESGTA